MESEELQGAHEVGGCALGGQARPHPRGKVVAPLAFIFGRYFSYFLKSVSVKFQVIPRTFGYCTINNIMAVLLKTALVRVSFIQIMQVRVQNKGKSVWKSRYVGEVSDGILTSYVSLSSGINLHRARPPLCRRQSSGSRQRR